MNNPNHQSCTQMNKIVLYKPPKKCKKIKTLIKYTIITILAIIAPIILYKILNLSNTTGQTIDKKTTTIINLPKSQSTGNEIEKFVISGGVSTKQIEEIGQSVSNSVYFVFNVIYWTFYLIWIAFQVINRPSFYFAIYLYFNKSAREKLFEYLRGSVEALKKKIHHKIKKEKRKALKTLEVVNELLKIIGRKSNRYYDDSLKMLQDIIVNGLEHVFKVKIVCRWFKYVVIPQIKRVYDSSKAYFIREKVENTEKVTPLKTELIDHILKSFSKAELKEMVKFMNDRIDEINDNEMCVDDS